MKFIDLSVQYQTHKAAIDAAMQRVLDHGQYIMGPEVAECEAALADYVGAKHAILNASGTTALHLALLAHNIGPGDEVITSAFSFFGTAEMILLVGAKPVYVDINADDYNLDISQVESAITANTKAIIPVSMYGQCPDMDALNAIANRHGLPVIEDGAQSFGARYKDRFSCALTTIGCTSFFPTKPLGCYGDGGACFTNDDNLADIMRILRVHGQQSRYHHTLVGINGRCDTIQAAVLIEKLKFFDQEITMRQQVAAWYNEALRGSLPAPTIHSFNQSAFAQYTVQVDNREALRAALQEQGIPTMVHYPKGLHQQPASGSPNISMPITETICERVMSLPFHPYLTQAEVQQVSEAVIKTNQRTSQHSHIAA